MNRWGDYFYKVTNEKFLHDPTPEGIKIEKTVENISQSEVADALKTIKYNKATC